MGLHYFIYFFLKKKLFFHAVSKDSFLRRHLCLSCCSCLRSDAAGAARVFSYLKDFEVITITRNTLDQNTYNLVRGKLVYYVNKCSRGSFPLCCHSYPLYVGFSVKAPPDSGAAPCGGMRGMHQPPRQERGLEADDTPPPAGAGGEDFGRGYNKRTQINTIFPPRQHRKSSPNTRGDGSPTPVLPLRRVSAFRSADYPDLITSTSLGPSPALYSSLYFLPYCQKTHQPSAHPLL